MLLSRIANQIQNPDISIFFILCFSVLLFYTSIIESCLFVKRDRERVISVAHWEQKADGPDLRSRGSLEIEIASMGSSFSKFE